MVTHFFFITDGIGRRVSESLESHAGDPLRTPRRSLRWEPEWKTCHRHNGTSASTAPRPPRTPATGTADSPRTNGYVAYDLSLYPFIMCASPMPVAYRHFPYSIVTTALTQVKYLRQSRSSIHLRINNT